ncbi:MAG: hypothetical protein ABFD92_14735 [Planctomycetaceae bacterium]|nr:hypothetical protein [Planctomycetaceae bacterium]
MGMTQSGLLRAINFAIVTVVLVSLCCGLVGIIMLSANPAKPLAGTAEQIALQQEYRYKMAWIATALLGMTVLLLAWMVIRHMAPRWNRPHKPPGSDYVDAWSLAGRRAKPIDPDEELS